MRFGFSNNASGNTRVFDTNGNILGTYNAYKPGETSTTYTYSDMTGLNRAMIFRTGVWESQATSSLANKHWGIIQYDSMVPSETSMEVYVKTSNDGIVWAETSVAAWNALPWTNRKAPYLKIRIILHSNQRGVTPVIWNLRLTCL